MSESRHSLLVSVSAWAAAAAAAVAVVVAAVAVAARAPLIDDSACSKVAAASGGAIFA